MKSPFTFLAALVFAAAAHGASFQTDQPADVVLGQPDFTSNNIAATAAGMEKPCGVAWDPATGKVFVADRQNNRVLRFSSAAAAQSGSSAEAVFGQLDFTSKLPNQGPGFNAPPSATTLYGPTDVCVDSAGRLWVADGSNNRVLRFSNAATLGNDPAADLEFGQPSFTTNTSGTTQSTMSIPFGIATGPSGVLWVAELYNNRVLRFDNVNARSSGDPADIVLGQPDFTTGTVAPTTAAALNAPIAVFADAAGRLWVADRDNNRVLRYDAAATKVTGDPADGVLGQSNFTSNGSGTTAAKMSGPWGVYLDPAGNLWVGEDGNGRVTRFSAAATLPNNAPSADLVLGQPDLVIRNTGGITARDMADPNHVAAGPGGSLFVIDNLNNRVLRFSPVVPPQLPSAPIVTCKGKKKFGTAEAKVTLKGTATNAAKVEIKIGPGKYKPAKGISTWTFKANLLPGKNKILIQSVAADGTTSPTVTVTVIRR